MEQGPEGVGYDESRSVGDAWESRGAPTVFRESRTTRPETLGVDA